jgi:hypothetical protein
MEVLEQHHDLEQVRALLGHARIDTTQIYTSIRPAQLKRCGLVLRGARDEDVERVRTCRRSMFEEHSDVPETRGEKLTKAKTKTRSLQSLVHIGGPQSPISNMVEFEVDLI